MKKYIQNFKVYLCSNDLGQEKGVDWLASYQKIEDKEFYMRYAVKPEYINSRHAYAKGISDLPYSGEELYSLTEKDSPTIEKRSQHAQEKIEEIFQNLYDGEDEIPTHLNHVSCTHYQSPSAAQKLVLLKDWFSKTIVTHLYHMGCYAALPGVRVSKAYIADGSNQVDLVHTELCSFHLNKEDTSAEQIIMNTLFSDGAIKYSVTSQTHFDLKKQDGLEIITQKEIIVPGSENEMTWQLGSHGFLMTLTRRVPILLAKNIETYMRDLFIDAGLDFDKDKGSVIFAIHPGGPKIIQLVGKVLKLENFQIRHSQEVLRKRGNMSSATIPHIWNEILEDKSIVSNTYIATVAFGPGLTMTGAILKLCRH